MWDPESTAGQADHFSSEKSGTPLIADFFSSYVLDNFQVCEKKQRELSDICSWASTRKACWPDLLESLRAAAHVTVDTEGGALCNFKNLK